MGRHRATPVRLRYGRLVALTGSLAVTTMAVLGGAGLLPEEPSSAEPVAAALDPVAAEPAVTLDRAAALRPDEDQRAPHAVEADPGLPAGSGHGRRVVFSESQQRVWLVEGQEQVLRTYLVSGSVYDNLDPGTYEVYSRSEHAYGIDDSGTMRYFVRFTRGENAAIGFHDIPVLGGKKVQTLDQLGTPLSHGCIRQRRADAKALWEFAPLGTTVVVTA